MMLHQTMFACMNMKGPHVPALFLDVSMTRHGTQRKSAFHGDCIFRAGHRKQK